jgi:hypothetical protein
MIFANITVTSQFNKDIPHAHLFKKKTGRSIVSCIARVRKVHVWLFFFLKVDVVLVAML